MPKSWIMEILKRPLAQIKCEWHQVNVEFDISYHGPSSSGFFYSCGCSTDFTKDSSTLTTDEGQTMDLTKQEDWPTIRPAPTRVTFG